MTTSILIMKVAVAIVIQNNRYLIAKRPAHTYLGGLWEFPGGKCEPNETIEQALQRELHEEMGIDILRAEPFHTLTHTYPGRVAELHFWKVSAFAGQPYGKEGQEIQWALLEDLPHLPFPEGNKKVLELLFANES